MISIQTRYYFNLVSAAGTVHDYEGTELSSIEHARREAIEDAKGLMSAAILEGRDISARSIEICNEEGEVLLTIAFRDAIMPDA
ncbi:DUF6894 family protein [Rhizobium soli]|nr:hypothetical protein [Rhizobium soli]